jgi:homoserine dehydrogenase
MEKRLRLGIFGFGVVGQGLYDIIKTKQLNLEIKKFVIKHPEKKRTLPQELFHTNPNDILEDPEINTVIELILFQKLCEMGRMLSRPTKK